MKSVFLPYSTSQVSAPLSLLPALPPELPSSTNTCQTDDQHPLEALKVPAYEFQPADRFYSVFRAEYHIEVQTSSIGSRYSTSVPLSSGLAMFTDMLPSSAVSSLHSLGFAGTMLVVLTLVCPILFPSDVLI